ncbi:MAG: hypothetical protein A2V83_07935 [Nitrospirae bacterium RBG_16_64_22]|nr:MAG: hypothetical protein A2V83_07935 [Nitrospirae bacterium RBG_16_64_22]
METTKVSIFARAAWLQAGNGTAPVISGSADSFCSPDRSLIVVAESDAPLGGKDGRSIAAQLAGLYANTGTKAFAEVRGAFRCVIWDGRRGDLIAATDPVGLLPVYYRPATGGFAVSSSLRTLAADSFPWSNNGRAPDAGRAGISPHAVMLYLQYGAVPTPWTIYEGVHRLPPGHFLSVHGGRVTLQSYWDLSYREDRSVLPRVLEKRLREEVERSVRSSLAGARDGRRVGCFLSGGTDSSTILGYAARVLGEPVHAFSIGFDEPGYDELSYARIASRRFGADHHEMIVTPENVVDGLDRVVDAYEEPFGNASAIPTYHCAVLARAHGVDLLLAGDGGDELFGGNERYAADHVFRRWHRIPAWLRRGVIEPALNAAPAAGVVDKGRRYVRRANIPHPDRFFSYNFVSALGARNIFDESFLARAHPDSLLEEARAHYARAEAESEINRLLYLDVKMALTDNDLRKVGGMCEAARVGVRFPYLDPALMSFSGTIPADLKVRGTEKRVLFKRAFRDFLPEEIIRKKKHGFGLPVGRWLNTKPVLRDLLHDTLQSRSARDRGIYRDGFVEEMLQGLDADGSAWYGDNLWSMLVLEKWMMKRPGQKAERAADIHAREAVSP